MCQTIMEAPPDAGDRVYAGDWIWNGLHWEKANALTTIPTATIRQLYGPDLDDFLMVLSALSDPQLTREQAAVILRKRFQQGLRTYVYVHAGQVVGTASLFVEQKFLHGGGKVGHIEDVAVHPDHQGKGFAKALVEHCVKVAKQEGCYKVILDCREEVVKFYEKLGFKKHEVEMRFDL